MQADIHTLYASDFYEILDFKCRCTDCKTSKPEYSHSFCISFVRKGNFLFNVFRHALDPYNGCILITKPGYERTVTHTHTVPDECTILVFKNPFYDALLLQYNSIRFLGDNDMHSTLIKTTAETDLLHFTIMHLISSQTASKLQIDQLVMEIIDLVLSNITPYKADHRINARLKRNHLYTLEQAKNYITRNFANDISLTEVADHCCLSPFHFSLIFKKFTSYSPHQFLLSIRLKHAEILLRNTLQFRADIAFSSGFNSIEHFISAFKQKYNATPTKYRTGNISLN